MENTDLAIEITLAGLSALILILVICLPLLPAILIYKIFPDTHIQANGSIGALTWNASGAFAAYMIVLSIIMFSPLKQLISTVGGFYSPSWTVEMEIHGYDQQSRPKDFKTIEVVLDPEIHRVSSGVAVLKIPGFRRADWPIAHFNVSGGSKEINLASLKSDEIEIDHYKKHITLLTPVVIKEALSTGKEYPAPGSGYLNQP
jgi:hypothetical protein